MGRVTMFQALDQLVNLHREAAEEVAKDVSREYQTDDGAGYCVTTNIAGSTPDLIVMVDDHGDAPLAKIAARMLLKGVLC